MLVGDMRDDIRMNKPYISTSMVALIILLKCKSGGGNKKAGQNFHFSTLRSPLRARVFAYVIVVTVACKFEIEKNVE